jgi:retron-type reverse transcriptase
LKCDIKKFFASIDHIILKEILAACILDIRILALLANVIESFHARPSKGLPLGNLTSQLLVNIYMNKFDQFAKHKLKAKYYIRYADDFVFLSHHKTHLTGLLPKIESFLADNLALTLHPHKVSISTYASGIDFLGWVHFPDHRALRTSTKRRALRNCVGRDPSDAIVCSYVGLLGWGNGQKVKAQIMA